MSRYALMILLATVMLAGTAVAQHDEHGEGDQSSLFFDPAAAPVIQPELDDFIPDTGDAPEADVEVSPFGVGGYGEVTGNMSVISVAPRWTINENFRAKVRFPWVLERKLEYFGQEATGSGLGDISVDVSYRKFLAKKRQRLEFTASIKLPTGDEENEDDGYLVPLGTGSVDGMAKVTYARMAKETSLLASLLYRLNSASETITEWPSSDPARPVVNTSRVTNANQLVGGLFGRKQMSGKLWVHLGATLMITGSGNSEIETDDPDFGTSSSENDLQQGSTLLDLFPGVSYQLGKLSPYLGVRLPVITSYDNESLDDSRDTAVVFQISYNPGRLLGS